MAISIAKIRSSCVYFSILLPSVLGNVSCNQPKPSNPGGAELTKFEITKTGLEFNEPSGVGIKNVSFTGNEDGVILARYSKDSVEGQEKSQLYFRLSEDGGATFGRERRFLDLVKSDSDLSGIEPQFTSNGIGALLHSKNDIFYARANNKAENWSSPVRINDTPGTVRRSAVFQSVSKNEIYCIWIDARRGGPLVFFSKSVDGGNRWSTNVPIDLDFRDGAQTAPNLVVLKSGRLIAIWQDKRDPKTLFDIRFAYSDDQGTSWSASEKVNDDQQEVWQILPSAIAHGSNIYIAFADFRERGEDNDNDWNIYLARSKDGGATWEKNVRINKDPLGRDTAPYLAVDPNGNLYCSWWSSRNTLFGQIVVAHSADNGASWSNGQFITDAKQAAAETYSPILRVAPNKFLLRWLDGRFESRFALLNKITVDSEKVRQAELNKKAEPPVLPLKYKTGKILFADDFSTEIVTKWKPKSGVWSVVDGAYRGVNPGNHFDRFLTFARLDEPKRYEIKGRFRMDPVAHLSASIHFRVSNDLEESYIVSNYFRRGAWLARIDNQVSGSSHLTDGAPLVQKRFSFRQNRWYKFTLVVTPKQVDYYIDGRLMFSHSGNMDLPAGRIGLGGFSIAPTYFDNISIRELK